MKKESKQRDLNGAVAIVTGAGSGVGAAVCRLLAGEGARIILVGRNENKLQKMQDEIGDAAEIFAGDVGDSAICERIVTETVQRHGQLDLLINNAGVMRRGNAAETSDKDWAEVMRTNVDGVFYMSRAAVRVMRERDAIRGGAIINTASTCGLVGAAGLAAYCTSKGAVVQLTRTMALECAPHNITVNAVCPGAIESPMLFSAHSGNASEENVRQRNKDVIPLRQLAAAEEVARAILYLAQELHITGSMLSIDGGYTAG